MKTFEFVIAGKWFCMITENVKNLLAHFIMAHVFLIQ